MAFPTGEDREVERAVLDQIAELGHDGLVIAPAIPLAWPELGSRARHPIVVIDRRPSGPRPDGVQGVLLIDNRTAVSVVTRRLIEQGGVQRLACLHGPLQLSSNKLRFEAVREVLARFRPEMLERPDDQWAPAMERHDVVCGEEAMNRLFLQTDDQVPDGVICLNGKMTVGALLAIRAHRKRVPHDIRFVGYDDGLRNYGLAVADPPPSLIRQDPEQLGRAAAKFITSRRDGRLPDVHVYVEPARFDAAPGKLPTCDKLPGT